MIKINHIDHLNMFVSDLELSLDFYQKLFGFEVKKRATSKGRPYAITGVSGKIMLALYEEKNLPSFGRVNHFGMHVANFQQVLESINAQGIKTYYGDPEEKGAVVYERSRSLYIRDPDGNEIELSENFAGAL